MKRGLNIYHRKDGRYEGRYANGYRENGNVKYGSVYGKTYAEVKEKLLQIKAKIITPETHCNLTVKELFENWLAAKQTRVKPSTYANYAFKVKKHLILEFGGLKSDMLTSDKIFAFIRKKQESGLSDKYISDLLIVLKNMMKYAEKTYHCTNLIADIELPKAEKHELNIYHKNEQNQLKSALLKNMDLTKLAILTALFTGVRIGELCGLKWSDIDFENRTLHIERSVQRIRSNGILRKTELIVSSPKSRTSDRIIPLPEFILNLLKSFQPSDKDCFILTNCHKIPDPRTLQYRFKAILRKNNLRDTNFHSLRHMFATNCIESGFDVKTLSEILGHSSVEITLNRYVHSSFERKRTCMDMLKLGVA